MAGVTMAATTLLLVALAAHAYIVSRLSQWPGWAREPPRQHPSGEDLPAPPDKP